MSGHRVWFLDKTGTDKTGNVKTTPLREP